MPRRWRLDAPGTLHHVIVRGIERRKIVNDVTDRKDFVGRLGEPAAGTETAIYAWTLIPMNPLYNKAASKGKGLNCRIDFWQPAKEGVCGSRADSDRVGRKIWDRTS